ncbi:linoleate 13S-lipoxygenase 3-1, chloroplastic-like isoform X2 [Abrus precatorius]|uniref:Lipoxygenase n=1 Tax=Abrus precatorius TaxID=3816 RepID=A0A8B8KP26_ABRPR|nr:linoleate 13S-lipoxygenase 3-1, chloroplastic-like isoform X2 [Abrus precatorius]
MAGTKSVMIMDSCNLHNKVHLSLTHSIENQRFRLVYPSTSRRGNMRFRVRIRKKGKQIIAPTVAALVEDEAISHKPTTMKLTALVVIRSNNKVFPNDMLKNLLSIFRPQNQRNGVVLQLVSSRLHPKSMEAKLSKETVLDLSEEHKCGAEGGIRTYKVDFSVESDFGVPGAVTVVNGYDSEFFLESITAQNVHFGCKSWVQPNQLYPEKRIFFVDKVYLPCETPNGLKELREMELMQLRGDGKGRRKYCDRIYDYDVYNDLGDPDMGNEYARPTLGGQYNPYPTRCRTGRSPTTTDKKAESRPSESGLIYVPRDEELEDIKRESIDQGKLMSMLRNVVPALIDKIMGSEGVFNIDYFIKESESKSELGRGAMLATLPPPLSQIMLNLGGTIEEFFKFDPPKIFSGEETHFLLDDELGRQVLTSFPLSIERLKVFPPVSKLDPSLYGSVESALKEEHIIGQIEGMSIQQALEENKLFILDYHDFYLPFLGRINALDERKAYATTTIFFLTKMGTLKPVAIQLSLPTRDPNTSCKQVLTPPIDATSKWLWQLGKAHVCSNDAGVHTLVHHWLRIHACMEPLMIAAHRQLSVMHPIFKLLHPHMRYTLKTNATTRQILINAEGTVETDHTPGRYCMQISSAAYKDWWRFDMEGLPADLIRRGLAVPDATQPHGIRLLIEDYPYAADGLLIWSSIEKLVRTYVKHYYKNSNAISSDNELQSWYSEFISLGHPDHKNAYWWPKLATPEDLISMLTIVIWLVSAQHAVLNFGQYPYGGYVPIRPPLMRKLIPKKGDLEYSDFVMDPQGYYLSALPSLFQATRFMAVINIGSAHSPDEEYIGDRNDVSSWLGEPEIIDAFSQFSMEITNIEIEIEKRNADPNLRNRCGVGVSPYELLIPSSGCGATGRGVPNSVTA